MVNEKIAALLLDIEAVFLSPDKPFTWASGIKSPIYCDNRLILTAEDERVIVETAIADTIKQEFPETEILMGTATAGIAHAAIVAHLLHLPMGYVRSSSKGHGRQNKIEGRLKPGQKVVVIEDLISTGGSVMETVLALQEAGAEVLGIVSIFTYRMKKSEELFETNKVKVVSLSDIDTVCKIAAQKKLITANDIDRILAFRDNPQDESWLNNGK
ncbi:MAG: orotate phosphoribosyltransferase [Clostridiaceae bacterium]|nr:orotate phosphoribosyltransferase [Clostridiaceae bacterium]